LQKQDEEEKALKRKESEKRKVLIFSLFCYPFRTIAEKQR
jgi:hypothetical protein